MKTVGYARTPRQATDIGVDEYTTDLAHALQAGDYIVSVLTLNARNKTITLSEMPYTQLQKRWRKVSQYSSTLVGGDVLDEESLIDALDNSFLSAAILDVFETEPLPKESKLWDRPDVIVSPHVSGLTQASDVPKVFLSNYERYINGEDLQYIVDWDKGY